MRRTQNQQSTKVTAREDEGHRAKPVTDKVPEYGSSKTKDATPTRGPSERRTRATLKFRRKRTNIKLKHRAARHGEEASWLEVDAEKPVNTRGLGNAPQQGTDLSQC